MAKKIFLVSVGSILIVLFSSSEILTAVQGFGNAITKTCARRQTSTLTVDRGSGTELFSWNVIDEDDSIGDVRFSNRITINRRNAMQVATAASFGVLTVPFLGSVIPGAASAAVAPTDSRTILLNNHGSNPKAKIPIPRVGFGLYKTDPAITQRSVELALIAGVRHFDVATFYKNSAQVGLALRNNTLVGNDGRVLRLQRKDYVVSHKVSNEEQRSPSSSSKAGIRTSIQKQMELLQCDGYLDICSIHSPLTDKARRLNTYETLLEMQKDGLIGAVGVCNYGVGALDEIIIAGLPPPAINQIELSPFNQHKDIAAWAQKYGMALSCASWSKLSKATGPVDGWNALGKIADQKKMTKAQVLVRWSLQKGYVCLPRTTAANEQERAAIIGNSYDGCSDASFVLNKKEMAILDSLDEQFKCGRLGRRDGWKDEDITGDNWEPTDFV